ncbi:MAG: reverse transcriptase-like protein [Sweet potato little leaf phytoplasma]|nr:reverse transcriptase-like protein [Sweet potato little leaf phytoplasma]
MILNVDAACDINQGVYRFGVLIRTSQGSAKVATHGQYPQLLNPLYVEARVVLEDLRLAQRMKIMEVVVRSDSLGLITMLNGEYSEAHAILWDIKLMTNLFSSIQFIYLRRDYNSMAHKLAWIGLRSKPKLWFQVLPF